VPEKASGFPRTHLSAVLATRSDDRDVRARALETLVQSYWKPVYKYLRLKWQATAEDAEDWTQGFFARSIEKGTFERYEPEKARFRTYLRTCLDGFVANEKRAARRLKRAPENEIVSLDFASAEGELREREIPSSVDLEEYFYREWVRSLFGLAVDAFREECRAAGKETHFELFDRYDLDDGGPGKRPTYQDLANEFSLPVTQVTNFLAAARRAVLPTTTAPRTTSVSPEVLVRADADAVRGVVERYREAMQSKSLSGVKSVYPALDERQLRSVLDATQTLQVELRCADVRVSGSTAAVECARVDRWSFKNGDRRTSESTATFRFQKRDGSWVIDQLSGASK